MRDAIKNAYKVIMSGGFNVRGKSGAYTQTAVDAAKLARDVAIRKSLAK